MQPTETETEQAAREKAKTDRGENRMKLATAAIGLLAAIATTFGVLSGVAAKKASNATAQVDESEQELQQLRSDKAKLQEELDAATAKINQMQNAVPGASPDPASGKTPRTTGKPAIYHQGPLQIPTPFPDVTESQDFYVDLDAPSNDPQWGTTGGGDEPDIEWK